MLAKVSLGIFKDAGEFYILTEVKVSEDNSPVNKVAKIPMFTKDKSNVDFVNPVNEIMKMFNFVDYINSLDEAYNHLIKFISKTKSVKIMPKESIVPTKRLFWALSERQKGEGSLEVVEVKKTIWPFKITFQVDDNKSITSEFYRMPIAKY